MNISTGVFTRGVLVGLSVIVTGGWGPRGHQTANRVESGRPVTPADPANNPINRANPLYNPETGTAPPGPPVKRNNF